MKFIQLLLVAIIIIGGFATARGVKRSRDPRERSFAIRTSIFFWSVGVLAVLGLMLLPPQLKIAAALPGALFVVSGVKAWKNVRTQIAEEKRRGDVERMKRVG